MSDSALISDDKVLFDKTLQIKNYNTSNQNLDIYEDFSFPLVVKIPFKNIENLSLFEISNYQKLIQESMIKDDLLFKLHLDKSFYKRFPVREVTVIKVRRCHRARPALEPAGHAGSCDSRPPSRKFLYPSGRIRPNSYFCPMVR